MKYLILVCALAANFTVMADEKRCGWLINPTPANLWLDDADGTWVITTQGVYSDLDDAAYDSLAKAASNQDEFVRTNGSYGYSCACLTVTTNKDKKAITAIHDGKQLLLKQCLEDDKLNSNMPN